MSDNTTAADVRTELEITADGLAEYSEARLRRLRSELEDAQGNLLLASAVDISPIPERFGIEIDDALDAENAIADLLDALDTEIEARRRERAAGASNGAEQNLDAVRRGRDAAPGEGVERADAADANGTETTEGSVDDMLANL